MCSANTATASASGAAQGPSSLASGVGIASLGVQTLGGIFSAIQQGNAGAAQERYYNSLSSLNNQRADLVVEQGEKTANSAQDQGAMQAAAVRDKAKSVSGAQTALLAANGVDVSGSTSAEQVLTDTLTKAQQDELAIRYNADQTASNAKRDAGLTALDLKNQSSDYNIAGRMKGLEASTNQFNTLLSTASSVGMQGYSLAKDGAFDNLLGKGKGSKKA